MVSKSPLKVFTAYSKIGRYRNRNRERGRERESDRGSERESERGRERERYR